MARREEEKTVFIVDKYTSGRMGPSEPMVGPIEAGDRIRAVPHPAVAAPLSRLTSEEGMK